MSSPEEVLTLLTELTLALILFHDAAQVRPRQITVDRGPMARLLLVGLPLTMAAGWLLGWAVFPGLPAMMLLLLAAAVAPTDAGLGAATVLNPVVPVRVRRMLNVESGLNDGLCTPFVLFAIAALAGEEGLGPGESIGAALVAGRRHPRRRRSSAPVPGCCSAGHATTASAPGTPGPSRCSCCRSSPTSAPSWPGATPSSPPSSPARPSPGRPLARGGGVPLGLTEALADPLGFAVWFAFGFIAVPLLLENVGWGELVFAVLALTLLRMVPVALALLGTGLHAPTVAFVGWFGPRGLASVVFTLLAAEGLELDAALTQVSRRSA